MLAKKEARVEITPLVHHGFTVPDSRISFTAACFGGEDTEWSLAPLQEPGDPAKHPHLTSKIRNAMRHLRADRIYAPSPVECNGRITEPLQLNKVMVLGNGILLFRNRFNPADGTFLRSAHDAGIFSAAGCSVVVVSFGQHLLFAHCGRDCVINRKRVLNKPDARQFESVVDSIIAEFFRLGYKRSDLAYMHVWPLYSIRPEDFVHKFVLTHEDVPDEKKRLEHMQYNNAMPDYLKTSGLEGGMRVANGGVELDVTKIATLQFMAHGVPEENIHLEHQYLSDELPTTRSGNPKARYLVSIVRCS